VEEVEEWEDSFPQSVLARRPTRDHAQSPRDHRRVRGLDHATKCAMAASAKVAAVAFLLAAVDANSFEVRNGRKPT